MRLRGCFAPPPGNSVSGVLNAHPDLAGKLAAAKRLTAESTAEQAAVGLDALTDAERETFTRLNDAYTAKFGFPFIIAVRDNTKATIMERFSAVSTMTARPSSHRPANRWSGSRNCA